MFLVNVEKCLRLFDRVFVSSDSQEILDLAEHAGAYGILRPSPLCGDTPNIPVYQHAIGFMENARGIVAVQANSPTVSERIISDVKRLLQEGYDEVMTMHDDGQIYGSVWGLRRDKLLNYGDPYKPKPDVLIKDTSVDIHTQHDLDKALCSMLAS